MRVCIDARWIFPTMSGIGSYTRWVIRSMAADAERREELLLLFRDAAMRRRIVAECGLEGREGIETMEVGYGPFSPAGQLLLPALLRKRSVDVFHSPNFMVPLAGMPCPVVVNIHDVIPLKFPEFAPRSRKRRVQPLTRWIMIRVGKIAAAIITGSECAARDIAEQLRIPASQADRIRVIPDGVDEVFRPGPRPQPGNDRRRLLFVGRADPYKNVVTALQALKILVERHGIDAELRIIGPPDPRYRQAARTTRELGLGDRVREMGQVSQEELLRAYRTSDVLIHPSRYEGFGLPVVEAMACGLPVVCSNAGSLPEVAGDAALFFEPDDAEGFARGAASILENEDLRRSLRERGLRRATRYRWETTARRTLEVYREVGRG